MLPPRAKPNIENRALKGLRRTMRRGAGVSRGYKPSNSSISVAVKSLAPPRSGCIRRMMSFRRGEIKPCPIGRRADRDKKRARQNRARLTWSIGLLPQVEYLNSGIAFSSSLVALNTA
jgi:hypothetical protein